MNNKYSKEIQGFSDLLDVLKRLRAPNGCPWDRQQTPETIKKYMIEEAYELYEAISNNESQEVKEELGDLFFLLLFLADLYEEKGEFSLNAALKEIKDKMIRRHPHIFGDVKINGAEDVVTNWQAIKGKEAKEKGKKKSALGNLPLALPALQRAFRLGERAGRVGFDWKDEKGVLKKLEEEIDELKIALAEEKKEKIEDELGDLLFTVSNLSRKLGFNPEDTLKKALNKFVKRFHKMEDAISKDGKEMAELDIETLESYWQKAKT